MFDERQIAFNGAIKVAPQWATADDIIATAEKFLAFLNGEKNPPGWRAIEISVEKAL